MGKIISLIKRQFSRSNDKISVRFFIALISIFTFVYCISLLVPLVWMFITSFKDEFNYNVDLFGLPDIWRFSNYVDVFKYMVVDVRTGSGLVRFNIANMFLNSIILSVSMPLINILFSIGCAYVMSKYKFKGNKFIYTLGIFVMVTPIVGNLPSAMLINRRLGIYNNMLMYILVSPVTPFSGLGFLVLYAAFKTIPIDFSEAAQIDGAGHYLIMFRIMIPIILPTATVLFVLNFIGAWNDYTTPLIWLPSYPNLPYGMYIFQMTATHGAGASTPVIMAGFSVIMLPTVLLYFLSQKIINSNFVVGGLKG